jgi:hypothetical protein
VRLNESEHIFIEAKGIFTEPELEFAEVAKKWRRR